MLEKGHRRSWALNGANTADNVRILCRAHNRYEAEQELGPEHIQRAIAQRREATPQGVSPKQQSPTMEWSVCQTFRRRVVTHLRGSLRGVQRSPHEMVSFDYSRS